jgi:hypothetical protein
VEFPTELLDVCLAQRTLAIHKFRNNILGSKHGNQVSLTKAVLLDQFGQDLLRLRVGDRIPLALVFFNERREEPCVLAIFGGTLRLLHHFQQFLCVQPVLRIRIDDGQSRVLQFVFFENCTHFRTLPGRTPHVSRCCPRQPDYLLSSGVFLGIIATLEVFEEPGVALIALDFESEVFAVGRHERLVHPLFVGIAQQELHAA